MYVAFVDGLSCSSAQQLYRPEETLCQIPCSGIPFIIHPAYTTPLPSPSPSPPPTSSTPPPPPPAPYLPLKRYSPSCRVSTNTILLHSRRSLAGHYLPVSYPHYTQAPFKLVSLSCKSSFLISFLVAWNFIVFLYVPIPRWRSIPITMFFYDLISLIIFCKSTNV